jgi:hypothetical protein
LWKQGDLKSLFSGHRPRKECRSRARFLTERLSRNKTA